MNQLNHCPVCRYSLEGLPAAHRCPECGFDYDENSSRFQLWPTSLIWWILWVGIGSQLPNIVRDIYNHRHVYVSLPLLITWLLILVHFIRSRLNPPFIAFGPREIVLRTQWLGRLIRYHWSELSFDTSRDKKKDRGLWVRVQFTADSGKPIHLRFFFETREAVRCRRHLRKYAR